MTTYIDFAPTTDNTRVPFQFGAMLDNQSYVVGVYWLVAGQRWYITLLAPSGTMVFNQALVGSPIGLSIASLAWDESGQALGTTDEPMGLEVGDTVDLVLSDCVPAGYNGKQRCLVTGPSSFSYPLALNPGPVTNLGSLNYDIDLLAGYGFTTSALVWRDANRQFEVSP
jgi:hypothetical protein